jgi:hypothetical protein
VCACSLCLTSALALEQFSDDPVDITSIEAAYSAGTVAAQPGHAWVAAPPHGRVEPGSVVT